MLSPVFLTVTLCVSVIVCISEAVPEYPATYSYDLCKKKNLQLETVGESGVLTFDHTSAVNDVSCVLKIEACSSCQIELRPVSTGDENFYCPTGAVTSRFCTVGCDYLYMFDMNYMNETMRYIQSWRTMEPFPFKSESSNVFILLCHGYSKKYSFKITYNTTKKLISRTGSSLHSSSGYIESPYFPVGYAQNHEVYTYIINSTNRDDDIRLIFDDWHISDTSVLNFGASSYTQYTGRSNRPVIVGEYLLSFTFHTGVSLIPGENRDFLGFRAHYEFFNKNTLIPKPRTDCKTAGYYLSTAGGKIEFSPSTIVPVWVDCLWVIGKKEGYDGIFLKVSKFHASGTSHYTSTQDNTLIVRDGISSIKPVIEVVKMTHLQDNHDGIAHFSATGFYLRLNASMSQSMSIVVSYASYKNAPGCSPSLYECKNLRCIDRDLVCDGLDHCGDNSDEVAGCGGGDNHWDKSYQYTITIGVIVPMVISVFLIMVICLLFVMIRRCRRAQLNEVAGSSERLRTVSEEVSDQHGGRRRRRRRRGLFGQAERDLPPTYDEAMQNPPGWYQNVAFSNPVDPTLPQPPSYHEAIGGENPEQSTSNQRVAPGSPVSTDSSQSEITMCSGNLSDSSSSSDDDGSTWGGFRGDGEGRQGRLGRHVSSSGSETYTTVDQSRSTIPSPDRNESASVNTSRDNVSAPRDVVRSTGIDPRLMNDNENIESVRERKISDKNLNKIQTSEHDDFVVPAGPKPGGSETSAATDRPRSRSSDQDSRNPSTSAPRPAPRKSLDNRKNANRNTETSQNRQNIKNQSTPPWTGRGTGAVNKSYDRSDSNPLESEHTEYHDTYSNAEAGTSSNYPSRYHSREQITENSPSRLDAENNPSRLVTESSPARLMAESSPSRLSARNSLAEGISINDSIDQSVLNHAVVNVDDDDVMIMYDSQSSMNRAGIPPPQYLLHGQNSGANNRHERNPVSRHGDRRRGDNVRDNTDNVTPPYSMDDSVRSAGSGELRFTPRDSRHASSEQLHTSHVSLSSELEDLEDVYV